MLSSPQILPPIKEQLDIQTGYKLDISNEHNLNKSNNLNTLNDLNLNNIPNFSSKSPVLSISSRNKNLDERREWDESSEDYIIGLKKKCLKRREFCYQKSQEKRRAHRRLAVPVVIIPIIMTPIAQIDECEIPAVKYILTVVFIIISILNAVNTYFDYSRKSEQLLQNRYKYDEILEEIEYQMSKPQQFRTNVNVMMSNLKNSINTLNRSTVISH